MHANAALLDRLFTALRERDHTTMASCYHPDARFRDIAFDLHPRARIHSMWRMICSSGLDLVQFEIIEAGDLGGSVRLLEKYRFGASKDRPEGGRPVRNAIESRFLFQDGKIWRHEDSCDAREWARQALGEGPGGFLAGRIRLLRSLVARLKLAKFRAAARKGGHW